MQQRSVLLLGGAHDKQRRWGIRPRCVRALQQAALVHRRLLGDGNCQYRLLALHQYASEDMHIRVRAEVVHELRSHPARYSEGIVEDYGSWVDAQQRNAEWGDHHTLQAALNIYRFDIQLYDSVTGAVTLLRPREELRLPGAAVHAGVYFPGRHYDAALPRQPVPVRDVPQQPPQLPKRTEVKPKGMPLGREQHRSQYVLPDHRDPDQPRPADHPHGDDALDSMPSHIQLTAVNVDSLRQHAALVAGLQQHVQVISEHKIPTQAQGLWRRWFSERGYRSFWASSPSQSANCGSGGVMLAVKQPLGFEPDAHPLAEKWKAAGRLITGQLLDDRGHLVVKIFAIYAQTDPQRHANEVRSFWHDVESLLHAWAPSPVLLLGDLQSSIEESPFIAGLVHKFDLGDIIQEIGHERVATHVRGGVIDHLLLSHSKFPQVCSATTDELIFPAHRGVTMTLRPEPQLCDLPFAQIPMPLGLTMAQVQSYASHKEHWPEHFDTFMQAMREENTTNAELAWSMRWERYLVVRLNSDGVATPQHRLGRGLPHLADVPPWKPTKPALAAFSLTYRQCVTTIGKLKGRQKRISWSWADTMASQRLDTHLQRRLSEIHGITVSLHREQDWDQALLQLLDELKSLDAGHRKQRAETWRKKMLQVKDAVKFVTYKPLGRMTAVENESGTHTSVSDIDDCLIDYWTSIAKTEQLTQIESFVLDGVPQEPEVQLSPFTAKGLRQLLTTFKSYTAAGRGGWALAELKALPDQAWEEMAELMTLVMRTGSTPVRRSELLVTYLRKRDDSIRVKYMRPISVAPILWRLFAKKVNRDLLPSIEAHLTPEQSGGRPARSTTDSVLEARLALDTMGPHALSLQLDIEKFFNTVPIGASLELLRRCGASQQVMTVLHAHYKRCGMRNRLPSGRLGRWWQPQRGLPQGDPLSVSLANLVMSSLLRRVRVPPAVKVFCYLDDICIISPTRAKLDDVAQQMCKAMQSAGLRVNVEKCIFAARGEPPFVCETLCCSLWQVWINWELTCSCGEENHHSSDHSKEGLRQCSAGPELQSFLAGLHTGTLLPGSPQEHYMPIFLWMRHLPFNMKGGLGMCC